MKRNVKAIHADFGQKCSENKLRQVMTMGITWLSCLKRVCFAVCAAGHGAVPDLVPKTALKGVI